MWSSITFVLKTKLKINTVWLQNFDIQESDIKVIFLFHFLLYFQVTSGKNSYSLLIKNLKIESKGEKKKKYLTFFYACRRRLCSEQIFWELHCCLATRTTLDFGVTLHNIWPERIFGNGDISDKKQFSGLQICCEKDCNLWADWTCRIWKCIKWRKKGQIWLDNHWRKFISSEQFNRRRDH